MGIIVPGDASTQHLKEGEIRVMEMECSTDKICDNTTADWAVRMSLIAFHFERNWVVIRKNVIYYTFLLYVVLIKSLEEDRISPWDRVRHPEAGSPAKVKPPT